jgi:serine/threonine protein kinase
MPDDPSAPQPTPTNYQRTTGGTHLRWQPPTPEHLQEMLPAYEILGILGQGGMGAVYKGRQKSLDRIVAIKILPPEAGEDDMQFVERFKNEARTMAKMNHASIVHVYDFGETTDGQLYIVMEFIDGTDVAKMIQSQGKLPEDYALSITAHVCDALQYAHTHGVVHRDIKPANVLINTEGQVKVADFGLAKATDPSQMGLTKTNMAMGTPDFVSPEALMPGVPLDGRADLYAVGVMLYNMLTGTIPRGAFRMPSVTLQTDARFDQIIHKAMEMDRERRYQTAFDMRRDLDVILTTPAAKTGMQTIPAALAQQSLPQKPMGKSPSAPQQRSADAPIRKDPAAKPSTAPVPKKSNAGMIYGIAAAAVVIAVAGFMFTGGGKKPAVATVTETKQEPSKPAPKPIPPPSSSNTTASVIPDQVLTFRGHRYQLVMERLIWEKARAKAIAMGGHLAVIDSKEKLDWAWDKFVSKLKKTPGDQASGRVYIGLQMTMEKPAWEWVTGKPLKVESWMSQLPEAKEGVNYVTMITDHRFDYVRPRIHPAAAFLVEWDDDGSPQPAPKLPDAPPPVPIATATPAPMPAVPADKNPGVAPAEPVRGADRRRSADLIALVDVRRDVVSDPTTGENVWKKENSSLSFTDGEKAGRIAAPVSLAGARAFEMELLWKKRAKNAPGTPTSEAGYIALDVPVGVDRWVRVEVAKAGDKVNVGGRRIGFTGPGTQNGDGMRVVVRSQNDRLSVKINGNDIGSNLSLAGLAEADLGAHAIFKSELLPAVYCARGDHEIVEWTVRALDGEVRLLWEPSLLQDARLAQLEAGYQSRYESDAQKPFLVALAALNKSYVANGIARVRAAAQAKGSLPEVTALDAEKAAIEKGGGVPAEDSTDIPESLKTLRTTYRTALARITADRDARAAPLFDLYLKALDVYIAELTKAGKIDEAKKIQSLRDEKAAQTTATADTNPPPAPTAPTNATALASGVPIAPAASSGSGPRQLAEWVLTHGGNLKVPAGGRLNYITKLDQLPAGKPDIVEITFRTDEASAAEVALLASVPNLGSLRIDGTKTVSLAFLRSLKKLQTLNLPAPVAGLEDWPLIGSLKQLRRLELRGRITDEQLARLSELEELEYLRLEFAPTGTGFAGMKASKKLRSLNLGDNGSAITDEGLAAIATAFPDLEDCILAAWDNPTAVTNEGLKVLLPLKSLNTLNVTGNGVDDGVFETLTQLRHLKSLNIKGTSISVDGAAKLRKALPGCNVQN